MLCAPAPVPLLARLFGRATPVLRTRARVTKRFAVHVPAGATRELPRAQGIVVLHCSCGQAWLTHDGDPRDVVLQAGQSCRIDRGQRLTAHAMDGECWLELQVDAA